MGAIMEVNDDYISINLHITQRCNMACIMCFSKYACGTELDEQGWRSCIDQIAQETSSINHRKINFVGGEPTLFGGLSRLLIHARQLNFTTAIVTNGRLVDGHFLDVNSKTLDWIGISVDSMTSQINAKLGRTDAGIAWGVEHYLDLANNIRQRGYKLKINTVVNAFNHKEDFNNFIEDACPERWKVFQYLSVIGQNEASSALKVQQADFQDFIQRHLRCRTMEVENAEDMKGSYIMIDPCGRPYGNRDGIVLYGKPISEAGLVPQLAGLGYTHERAASRGAFYF